MKADEFIVAICFAVNSCIIHLKLWLQ